MCKLSLKRILLNYFNKMEFDKFDIDKFEAKNESR